MSPGPNRFDDPHHQYPVRYLAEHLYVCLLEVLAFYRNNSASDEVLKSMTPGLDDPSLADLSDPGKVDAMTVFLARNRIAAFHLPAGTPRPRLVDVFNPPLLAELDRHHRIRRELQRPEVVAAYGENGTVHLDGSLIRNASKAVGRPVTQEISWLLIHVLHVQGLRYYSRHAEGQEAVCWALHGDLPVEISDPEAFDPGNPAHRQAVHRVAAEYDLPLPVEWTDG